MMRSNRITLLILVVLLAWIGWGLYSTARQMRLDKQLIAAVSRSDARAVKNLLDQGADPNTREGGDLPPFWKERLYSLVGVHPRHHRYLGTPVLCIAVCNGDDNDVRVQTADQIEIVRRLVAKGADVNTRNDIRFTPISQPPMPGDSPLIDAAMVGHIATARLLLNAGADVSATDGIGTGGTPLYFASQSGDTVLVQMLLERGAAVNARSDQNGTPLMVAARNDNLDTVRVLIGHGADVNARDEFGDTALRLARPTMGFRAFGNPDTENSRRIRAYLIQHGAKE